MAKMHHLVLSILMITTTRSAPLHLTYPVQEDYVPILGYHRIGDTTDSITVTKSHFRDQVSYLTNTYGCNWITMNTLADLVSNGEKLPTKACIMNFDDGISSQYNHGLCSLNEHQVPATFYVIYDSSATSNGRGSSYHMSLNDIQELSDIGHDIQSHSISHPHLDTLTRQQQETEILLSQDFLEMQAYNDITSFAYPYGDKNADTFDILRDTSNDFILGRDTSQDYGWKDIRPPVISYNADYKLHFYYIKPEGYSGDQLADLIQYTSWWQFEDNYKVINDADGDVKISSSSSYLPTTTSYAILAMYDTNDEISTQFITKYTGQFTIDILLYGTNIDFSVKIDATTYTPQAFANTHSHYMSHTAPHTSGLYIYNNYYVNSNALSPGIHTFNIINNRNSKIYLDKFRIFSNVDQSFTYTEPYVPCDPATSQFCNCDATPSPTTAPPPDPTCSDGILSSSGIVCCDSQCGTCAGSGCGSRPGGAANCCQGTIVNAGNLCSNTAAPCVM